MKRYAAFLRGVSPMNAKMPELKKAFEAAGFTDVRTMLSSGNVVFSAPAAPEAALERKAEAAMKKLLGSAFPTIVRRIAGGVQRLRPEPARTGVHGAHREDVGAATQGTSTNPSEWAFI